MAALPRAAVGAPPFGPQQFLMLGFESRGFTRYHGLQEASKKAKFKSLFGTSAEIIAIIWDALRTSNDPSIAIDRHCKPIYLLLTYRWLKAYESEVELEIDFNISVTTISKWCECLTYKISCLRQFVVRTNYFVLM